MDKNIEYVKFDKVNASEFLKLMNSQKVRVHLVEHALFDNQTIKLWIQSKIEVNAQSGCKVRAVLCDNNLVGWCGVQKEFGQGEIAIIIDSDYWGIGKKIFRDMMHWARELDHEEINIHFLETRREYRFLKKISKNVAESVILGRKFTTYTLAVK